MQLLTSRKKSIILVLVPLLLSAFIHLWNLTGFPDIFYDEGVYMYRTMHVLAGEGPQVGMFHDHPFFGQLFLAGILGPIGYPNSLHPAADVSSIQMLYLVPRILMGLLAIADTFLLYKICEKRYDSRVALFASILFAVMPITWLLRRILLDSILLPFMLSSILFALYTKDSSHKKIAVIVSGVLFGIVLFTKESVFAIIPLIAYLVYENTKSRKMVGLWFIPAISIPMIWPIQIIISNQFHRWIGDILFQVHRENQGFGMIVGTFFVFDPVLFTIGIAGMIYAAIRKDWMILLWIVPFVVFLASISYDQYFYWIPVLPVFCIAASKCILDFIEKKSIKISPMSAISIAGIYGLIISTILITSNIYGQYDAAAYVLQNVHNTGITNDKNNITIVSSPVYSWIFKYVFHVSDTLTDYRDLLFYPAYTANILLVADYHFMHDMNSGKQLQNVYNNTTSVKKIQGVVSDFTEVYPYSNMVVNFEGRDIDIRESK